MYNRIGLQSPKGPKTNEVDLNKMGFEVLQVTAGVTRKPNKDILEHNRKRQIQLKLVELEDKLIDQGYTDAEIAEKIEEARKTLEAAAASEASGGLTAIVVADKKTSDTHTHKFVSRKKKQMETLGAALGISSSEPHEQSVETRGGVELESGHKKNLNGGVELHEKCEYSILDREYSSKKRMVEDSKSGKDDMKKVGDLKRTKKRGYMSDEQRDHNKEGSRRRMLEDDSSGEDSSADDGGEVLKHMEKIEDRVDGPRHCKTDGSRRRHAVGSSVEHSSGEDGGGDLKSMDKRKIHLLVTQTSEHDDREAVLVRILASVLGSENAAKEALDLEFISGYNFCICPVMITPEQAVMLKYPDRRDPEFIACFVNGTCILC